jgi:hypothetical protein
MKKVVLRYGGYAALGELVTFVAVWALLTLVQIDIKVQGTISWFVIISPLVFVYFGIKYYRDNLNGGSVTFLKALQIGLLMILIPAVAYAIIETVYVLYINPDFYANIARHEMEEFRETLSSTDFAAKMKEVNQQLEMDKNPAYNFSIMVLIIYALGTVVVVLSSLLLFRKTAKS